MVDGRFDAVLWNENDLINVPKLAQMGDNDQWLKDHTPQMRYVRGGVDKETGLKLIAGILNVGKDKGFSKTVTQRFPGFFASDCFPIITIGLITDLDYIHASISGLADSDLQPTSTGFKVTVQSNHPNNNKRKLNGRTYISWQALGY